MSDIIPITPLPNAAATSADGLGCHAGKDQLLDAAAKAGKSEVLRTMVAALAATVSPEQCSFVLVDYKGGSVRKLPVKTSRVGA